MLWDGVSLSTEGFERTELGIIALPWQYQAWGKRTGNEVFRAQMIWMYSRQCQCALTLSAGLRTEILFSQKDTLGLAADERR